MATDEQSFRDRLRRARPDVASNEVENAIKIGIASKLRILRDARGMTQNEVAKRSGMTQSSIARLESLHGPTPTLVSIKRYVDACGGHLDVSISADPKTANGTVAA